MINVVINGYKGKMGEACIDAVTQTHDMTIVGKNGRGESLSDCLIRTHPDVVVDLTHPSSVYESVLTILTYGCHAVVGTTGLTEEQFETLGILAKEKGKALIVCPNFAIGAILMMQFATKAAMYMDRVEIIELHHDKKADAPSGTSLKTAELIAESNPDINRHDLVETETIPGARGGLHHRIPIHSVRLPGIVANQEVILGGLGQTLSIKHETISRNSFMPGILLCIRKAKSIKGLIYGLEHLL
jgi:4-hydroxy-tetrahydrodipicolinate reductase